MAMHSTKKLAPDEKAALCLLEGRPLPRRKKSTFAAPTGQRVVFADDAAPVEPGDPVARPKVRARAVAWQGLRARCEEGSAREIRGTRGWLYEYDPATAAAWTADRGSARLLSGIAGATLFLQGDGEWVYLLPQAGLRKAAIAVGVEVAMR